MKKININNTFLPCFREGVFFNLTHTVKKISSNITFFKRRVFYLFYPVSTSNRIFLEKGFFVLPRDIR